MHQKKVLRVALPWLLATHPAAASCGDPYSYQVCEGGACACRSCSAGGWSWNECEGCEQACEWCIGQGSGCC